MHVIKTIQQRDQTFLLFYLNLQALAWFLLNSQRESLIESFIFVISVYKFALIVALGRFLGFRTFPKLCKEAATTLPCSILSSDNILTQKMVSKFKLFQFFYKNSYFFLRLNSVFNGKAKQTQQIKLRAIDIFEEEVCIPQSLSNVIYFSLIRLSAFLVQLKPKNRFARFFIANVLLYNLVVFFVKQKYICVQIVNFKFWDGLNCGCPIAHDYLWPVKNGAWFINFFGPWLSAGINDHGK